MKFKKIIVLTLFSLTLLGCKEQAKGIKVGHIVKCASEGFIFKTYECEIIRGGLNNSSGSFGKSFHFTIENEDLIRIANKALNEQKEVKLSYHQEWTTLWRTETSDNSFADDIEVIK